MFTFVCHVSATYDVILTANQRTVTWFVTKEKLYGHIWFMSFFFFLFYILKHFTYILRPHLLWLFRRMLQNCFAVKLQGCFCGLQNLTWLSIRMRLGRLMTPLLIFGWAVPLRCWSASLYNPDQSLWNLIFLSPRRLLFVYLPHCAWAFHVCTLPFPPLTLYCVCFLMALFFVFFLSEKERERGREREREFCAFPQLGWGWSHQGTKNRPL